ncbi:response regulator transcription factor [Paenibacillus chartarius]|uniref:Response regulator transcription factor n=1 Tax=Paenibacillus chartarius TaxID=747481 RepID=A0ABV6DK68_9BACL
MSGDKVLVIDDDEEIRNLIRIYLSREGLQVVTLPNGNGIRELILKHEPKLVLLDLLLPGPDGYELCQLIRSVTDAPVIFVSCKDEEADKIIGLGLGGDDYITKPFGPGELVARVKAHLRRYRQQELSVGKSVPTLTFKGLEIDVITRKVTVSGKEVQISSTEFELLYTLAKHPDRVYRPEQLFTHIWGVDSVGDIRTLQVHMSNLRKKIETQETNPKYIVTIRGMGYKFNGHACF